MALTVLRQGIEVERLIGEGKAQLQVKAEALVPGAGREAVEVLLDDARLSLDSAEVQTDRVVMGGHIECQAIYRMGEDSQVRSITAQTSFEQVADIPGAGPRMTAQTEGEVEHVDAVYESGHMVFYVTVLLKVRVVNLAPVEVISELNGVEGLEQSYTDVCSAKLNAEAGVPVTLRDEVSLPAALHARVALMYWATPRIESSVRDLGGARVIGDVSVEALIASGVQGRPVALLRYTLPYEQLVEFPDWLSGDVEARCEVKNILAELEEGEDNEDAVLKLALEMELTVGIQGQDCVRALKDAYATGGEGVTVTTEKVALCGGVEKMNCAHAFKGTVMLPDGAPGVGNVLAVRVRPAVSEWHSADDETVIEGVLETTVIYMPGGSDRLSGVRSELPFEMHCEGTLKEDAWLHVTASDAEASALMSDRLELKCTLKAVGTSRITKDEQVAVDAEEADMPASRSGMVISFPGSDDTLWTIGKKYRLPVESIRALNGGMEQVESGKPIVLRL